MEAWTRSALRRNGGVNRDPLDFNVFASELFQTNIAVHKTASADIDRLTRSPRVDLRLRQAFRLQRLYRSLGAKEDYNDLAMVHHAALQRLISETFFDGKIGALLSAAWTKRAVVEDGSENSAVG